jgi:hypothetical protein
MQEGKQKICPAFSIDAESAQKRPLPKRAAALQFSET